MSAERQMLIESLAVEMGFWSNGQLLDAIEGHLIGRYTDEQAMAASKVATDRAIRGQWFKSLAEVEQARADLLEAA